LLVGLGAVWFELWHDEKEERKMLVALGQLAERQPITSTLV